MAKANSFKFDIECSQSGFVKLKAKYKSQTKTFVICVKDSGVGVKHEEKYLIFQEDIQLNLDQNYNVKGSGLGLSICKTLANSLGLELSFNSTNKKGSKFKLEFNCEDIVIKSKECLQSYENNMIQKKNSKITIFKKGNSILIDSHDEIRLKKFNNNMLFNEICAKKKSDIIVSMTDINLQK